MRVGIEEDLDTRADIAVRGVRMDAPVQRSKGAGPSDDGHLVVDTDGGGRRTFAVGDVVHLRPLR